MLLLDNSFGLSVMRDHHHMHQHFELFYKLLFAWGCMYIWRLNFLCPNSTIHYTKDGVSGGVWVTSTCLDSQLVGSIILFGLFQRLLSSFLGLAFLVGPIRPHLNRNGTVLKMSIFLVLSFVKVLLSCRFTGTYKSAPGYVIVSFYRLSSFSCSFIFENFN